MQCAASFDPALDLTFVWSFNGYVIDFNKENIHYQRNFMLDANGELLIRNAQLKHAGRYTCTAQTIVDNSSASADLVVRDVFWEKVVVNYWMEKSTSYQINQVTVPHQGFKDMDLSISSLISTFL